MIDEAGHIGDADDAVAIDIGFTVMESVDILRLFVQQIVNQLGHIGDAYAAITIHVTWRVARFGLMMVTLALPYR